MKPAVFLVLAGRKPLKVCQEHKGAWHVLRRLRALEIVQCVKCEKVAR